MSAQLRRYFAKRAHPYAGAVIEISRGMTSAVGIVSAILSLLLLAVAPPATHEPALDWAVAGGAVAVMLGGGLLAAGAPIGWDALARIQLAGLAAAGALVWATGGIDSPHSTLVLLWIVVFAASHPPRRAIGVAIGGGAVTLAPLVYDDASAASAGATAAQAVAWFFMAAVANAFVVSIRHDRLQRMINEEEASTLARVDPLTGLGNRRAFNETLVSLLGRVDERAPQLSMVVADIDNFKEINDRFGHLEGDSCLRQVSTALRDVMRGHDYVFRWGGDEFAVLLPDSGCDDARLVAQRLAEVVESSCTSPDGGPLRATSGCAELEPGMSADEFVAAADMELMAGKPQRARMEPAQADLQHAVAREREPGFEPAA